MIIMIKPINRSNIIDDNDVTGGYVDCPIRSSYWNPGPWEKKF